MENYIKHNFAGFSHVVVATTDGHDHVIAAFGANSVTKGADRDALVAQIGEWRGLPVRLVVVPPIKS